MLGKDSDTHEAAGGQTSVMAQGCRFEGKVHAVGTLRVEGEFRGEIETPELLVIGKTGAARMALMTGVPVIPIAQWGAERVISPNKNKVRLFPRQTMQVRAGNPVDLDDLRDREITTEVLEDATERIMFAITLLLAEIRQEIPPAVRFNPRNRRKAAE